jgi:hypothetical protein
MPLTLIANIFVKSLASATLLKKNHQKDGFCRGFGYVKKSKS